jgi:hypothetical protein
MGSLSEYLGGSAGGDASLTGHLNEENPHGISDNKFEVTAGEALLAFAVAYIGTDGNIYTASFDNLNIKAIAGIIESDTLLGNEATIINGDEITNSSWNFTPGNVVYLGLNGEVVDTPPTMSLNSGLLADLGIAKTSDTIVISIKQIIEF